LKEQYDQSLSIAIQNFHIISFEALNKLSNSQLLKILLLESLQIYNEDYLFKIILNMIDLDKNRMILLQTIHFEFVSSDLLKRFFGNISHNQLDFELFNSLKKRLFLDYSDSEKLSKRWKSRQKQMSFIIF
jgi:hypothetical protein